MFHKSISTSTCFQSKDLHNEDILQDLFASGNMKKHNISEKKQNTLKFLLEHLEELHKDNTDVKINIDNLNTNTTVLTGDSESESLNYSLLLPQNIRKYTYTSYLSDLELKIIIGVIESDINSKTFESKKKNMSKRHKQMYGELTSQYYTNIKNLVLFECCIESILEIRLCSYKMSNYLEDKVLDNFIRILKIRYLKLSKVNNELMKNELMKNINKIKKCKIYYDIFIKSQLPEIFAVINGLGEITKIHLNHINPLLNYLYVHNQKVYFKNKKKFKLLKDKSKNLLELKSKRIEYYINSLIRMSSNIDNNILCYQMKQEDILDKTAKAHDKEVKKSDLVSLPGSNVPKTETTTAPSNAIILLPSNGTNTDSDITNAVPDADGSDPDAPEPANEATDSNAPVLPNEATDSNSNAPVLPNEPTDSNAPDNRPSSSSSDSGPFLNSLPQPPLIDLSSIPGRTHINGLASKGSNPRPLNAGNKTSRVPSKGKGLPGNNNSNNGVSGPRSFSTCSTSVGLLAAGNNTSRVPSKDLPGGVPGTRSCFSSCVGLLAAGNNTFRAPSLVRNEGFPGNNGVSGTRSFSSCVGISAYRQSLGIDYSTSSGLSICAVSGTRGFSSVSKGKENASKGKRSLEKKIKRLKEKEKELTLLLKKKENEKKRLLQLKEEADILLKLAKNKSNKDKRNNKLKKESDQPIADSTHKEYINPSDDLSNSSDSPRLPLSHNTGSPSESPPPVVPPTPTKGSPSESPPPVVPPGLPPESPKPLMSMSGLPSFIPTSLKDFASWENSMRYLLGDSMKYFLVLLAGLSPIGLLYRLIPLNSSWILNISSLTEKLTTSYEDYKFVLLSYVAAFALSYAFHYRKMKDPKRIAVMFLQVMLIFPLILLLRLMGGEDGLDPAPIPINPSVQDSADHSDVPLTPPSNTAVAGNTAENTGENTAWYYNKKFWVGITIVGLAAIAYYLKGSAPASPDDMSSFHTAVSQGIDRVSSEQVSLGQTLAERLNSAAFQVEILNRNSEGMLSDIALAGEAARQQLEQMTGVTQDLSLLSGRLSTIDESMSSLLRGIVYLISLRWVLSRHVSGSEGVNRFSPFSFENVVLDSVENQGGLLEVNEIAVQAATETAEISTQTENTNVEATSIPTQTGFSTDVEVTEISTQTDNTDSDRVYSILRPAIQAYGFNIVLLRLRQVIPVIESILSIDSEEDSTDTPRSTSSALADSLRSTDSVDTPEDVLRPIDSVEDVPALETETSSYESTEHSSVTRSPETPERSPVTQSPETRQAGRSLDYATPLTTGSEATTSQSSEFTPQSEPSVDRILVCDNPTFQSRLETSTPTSLSPDDTNPYQVHRHNVFRIRVGRHLPCFLQLLDRLGI